MRPVAIVKAKNMLNANVTGANIMFVTGQQQAPAKAVKMTVVNITLNALARLTGQQAATVVCVAWKMNAQINRAVEKLIPAEETIRLRVSVAIPIKALMRVAPRVAQMRSMILQAPFRTDTFVMRPQV